MRTVELKKSTTEEPELDKSVYCISPFASAVKRTFDILLSIVACVCSAPLSLLIAFAVRMEDGGSPIFKQERVGFHGNLFTIYKFRSMHIQAEKNGTPMLCQADDSRLTHVGRFIRNHHLDELPQLWNILRGDMSFVGPRPERKYFVDQITSINPSYTLLYKLRPGIFSEATLYNGYTDTMDKMLERLRMDLNYLAKRTFWLDIKIIVITVASILTGKKF